MMIACVLARIARALVHRLAEVDPVVEQLVEVALVDRPAALACVTPSASQLPRQHRRRADPDEPLEDRCGRSPPRPLDHAACGPRRRSRAARCRPSTCPCCRDAANLSRMRSPITSRSNWAKESRMFSVSRPIEVVVLNDCVTETKVTPCAVEHLDQLREVHQRARQPVDLVDDDARRSAPPRYRRAAASAPGAPACRRRSRHRRSGRGPAPSPRSAGWRRRPRRPRAGRRAS